MPTAGENLKQVRKTGQQCLIKIKIHLSYDPAFALLKEMKV